MGEEKTLRTNYWSKEEIAEQVRAVKVNKKRMHKRAQKALKEMDPEVRKILEKFLAKGRAIKSPTGTDLARLAGEFADEMMERGIKKFFKGRHLTKFERKCRAFFFRPPGGMYKLAQKRLREQRERG